MRGSGPTGWGQNSGPDLFSMGTGEAHNIWKRRPIFAGTPELGVRSLFMARDPRQRHWKVPFTGDRE